MSSQGVRAPKRVRKAGVAALIWRINLLFTGVFSGFLVAVLVLEASLRGYSGRVYAQVRQVELDSLDKLAAATLIPALVTTVLLVLLRRAGRDRTFWLTVTALALMVVVLVITLTINMPINADQLDWNVQAPPKDWADVRDRWQTAHVVRTVAALAAFAVLLATVGDRPRHPVITAEQNARETGIETSTPA